MNQTLQLTDYIPQDVSLYYVDYRDDLDEHEDIQEECVRSNNRYRKSYNFSIFTELKIAILLIVTYKAKIMVYILLVTVLILLIYSYNLKKRIAELERVNNNREPHVNSEVKKVSQFKQKIKDSTSEKPMTFPKAVEILGMRMPTKSDCFSSKGEKQYIKECDINQLNVGSHLNICMMIPVLNLKGFHIEFVKNGMDRINFSDNEELASLKWHQKYDKIIFDSNISCTEFCNCIREIMKAHYLTEIDNNPNNLSTNQIEEKDSYFIWRALYTMQYHIKLKRFNEEYTRFKINNHQILIERNYNEMSDLWNDNPIFNKKLLEEFIEVKQSRRDLIDSSITLDKGLYGYRLIFKDDILTGHNRFFYHGGGLYQSGYPSIHSRYIVFTDTTPFYGSIWKGNTSSYDEYILTDGMLGINLQETEDILIQYLFVILKLVFFMLNKYSENNKTELKLTPDVIKKLELIYPCRLKQYNILKELDNRHLTEANDIIDYLEEKEQLDIVSNIESMVDTIINVQSDIKEIPSINSTEYYGSSYSFCSTYVKGHYRKNGSYVTGHFRRK